ncbi:MAG: hypothetical protein IJQ67_00105 [Bacilli bacterium]|nr:hypothetical protein [Bacilli bacterium]
MMEEEKNIVEETSNSEVAVNEEVKEEVKASEVVTEENNGKKKREKKPKSKARIIIEWVLTIVFAGLFIFAGIGQINAMINKKQNFNQNLPYGYGSFVVQTNSMEPTYKVKTAIITHKVSGTKVLEMFNKPNVSHVVAQEGNIIVYEALWTNDDLTAKEHGYVDLSFMDVYQSRFAPHNSKYYDQTNVDRPTTKVMTHRLREVHVDLTKEEGKGRYVFVVAGINEQGNQSVVGQYQAFNENYILGVVILNSAFLGGFFGFLSSPWGLLVFLLVPAGYLVVTSVLDIFKTMKDDEEPETAGAGDGKPSEKKGVDSLDSLSKEDKERLKREMLDEIMNKKGK